MLSSLYQGIIAFCLFLLFAHRQWKHESSIQSVMIRGVLFAIVLVVLSYIHEDDSFILEGALDMNCSCLQNCIKGDSSIVDKGQPPKGDDPKILYKKNTTWDSTENLGDNALMKGDYETCEKACNKNPLCKGFTANTPTTECYLKGMDSDDMDKTKKKPITKGDKWVNYMKVENRSTTEGPALPKAQVPKIPTKSWDEIKVLWEKKKFPDRSKIDAVYCPEENPKGPTQDPWKWYGFTRQWDGTLSLKPIRGVSYIVNQAITKFGTFEKSDIQVIPVDLKTVQEHIWVVDGTAPNIGLVGAYIGNGLDFG